MRFIDLIKTPPYCRPSEKSRLGDQSVERVRSKLDRINPLLGRDSVPAAKNDNPIRR